MAFIQVSMMSGCLMRTVPVNVILPADKLDMNGRPAKEEKPFKTLYLLHGIIGSSVDWVNGTRIQRFAEENDLAVIMPSGDNAFYVDRPESHNFYGEFIGRELVELTRRMFPLSRKREDTFIGGLSMGGYGAMRNGLKYSDTFGRIISLSGALHLEAWANLPEKAGTFFGSAGYIRSVFGTQDILGTDFDPKYLVKKLKAEGRDIPIIYMACGESDHLISANDRMAEFLRSEGVNLTYEVGPGAHEWDFWDTYIKKAIDWLPTETASKGVSSGNVLRD